MNEITTEERLRIVEELNRTANDSLGGESLQRALARITGAKDTSWRGVMRRVAELIERPVCRNIADYTKESFRCSECGCRVLVPGDKPDGVLVVTSEAFPVDWYSCPVCGAVVLDG